MTAIDKAILDTDENICKNIKKISPEERGFLSQNLLGQLRNFVEYIGLKLCSGDININPNIEYKERVKILKQLGSRTDLHFLYKLHDLLQKSASHYTLDENASERLMLKYYEYLLKIKNYLKKNCNLDVLHNIEDFPINTDKDLQEFYEKISEKIDNFSLQSEQPFYNEKLYIQKIKPFFVHNKIYYEVTFTLATDNVSKFDRVIAFTNLEIVDNYAVKFTIHKDKISIVDNEMEINIIDSWIPAIRSCELNNLNFILNGTEKIKSNPIAYNGIMNFIHDTNMNLLDLIISPEDLYTTVKNTINKAANNTALFDIFDKCRNLIINNKPGSNILRYLLFTMNNKIIKKQVNWERPCDLLSNLYLNYGTIPFDQMPFTTSLKGHNPKIYDLLECIETTGKEYQFIARYIRKNTEQNNILFTNCKNFEYLSNTEDLINIYNSKIYPKHKQRRSIKKFNQYYYINEYAEDCSYIIKQFKEYSTKGLKNYSSSVESWLLHNPTEVDDLIKRKALTEMFENSRVSFIYGSAGTGKSTLIKHISNFFANREKIFLANTNPAVENLKRKVKVTNCEFMTISKFLVGHKVEYDILFVDECSTVSNSDMRKILETTNFKLIVLVGDIYQIEAIQFGNWFSLSKQFIPQTSIFELTNTFRSSDENLKRVWDRVRNLDDGMQEALDKFNYTKRLDNTIFEKNNKDEIILCLNYDGLYGINNINTFLQNSNKNKSYNYGLHSYKIGDPILFNEANKFTPIIYNNMKGWIRNIKENEQLITFDIEIEASLNELDVEGYAFTLLGNADNGNSIIRFSIEKNINTDDDNESNTMPFQIAYAISIHKAQGLEYDSVKIIISNEIEEQITHNIFYTAITRARKELQIYWSPEVEHNILSKLKMKQDNEIDAKVLKLMYKL